MEDKAYEEYLREDYISNISKQVKFHADMIFYYIDALKEEGMTMKDIEEQTGIEFKMNCVCIFDNSK